MDEETMVMHLTHGIRSNLLKAILASLAILSGIVLSLFNRWELSHETWLYWFFARVLSESGKFIILDRSPLYTLYLNGFRWLGYPDMVIAEYIVTSCIVIAAIVVLLRPYLGLYHAIFAALLWIPFLQVSEPPVQKLALACSCFAVVARRAKGDRFKFSISYALLGLAYMFRTTYIVIIPLFAAWDVIKILRQKKLKSASLRPRLTTDWPVLLVISLLILFVTMQSSHPWNNAWVSDTTWFPSQGKTLAEGVIIQNYNWKYIEIKYGIPEGKDLGKDFYFTNQELFSGETTIVGAIIANPQFIIEQIGRSGLEAIHMVVFITLLPAIYVTFPFKDYLTIFIFIAIMYGAFRASKEESIILLVVGTLLILGATIIGVPKTRYMPPLIPVLILSAYWYGTWVKNIITKKMLLASSKEFLFWIGLMGVSLVSLYFIPRVASMPHNYKWFAAIIGYVISISLIALSRFESRDRAQRCLTLFGKLAVPIALVIFSMGPIHWVPIIQGTVTDFSQSEVRVMEQKNHSIKASFAVLEPLVQDCNGIMSEEHTFIGAFMNVPLDRVHDIWEIPPFGHLGDPVYDGLKPDRIDCVLISHTLATDFGWATNSKIRYQNYIKPYVEKLQAKGATTYQVEGFGQFVILRNIE